MMALMLSTSSCRTNVAVEHSEHPTVYQYPNSSADLCCTSLFGDGSVGQLVIFTNDDNVSEDVGNEFGAKIFSTHHNGNPSADLTLRVFDAIHFKSLKIKVAVMDNGSEFNNKEVKEWLEDNDIKVFFPPPRTAYCFNPCDHSYHSTLKHYFWRNARPTHEDGLKLISRYYVRLGHPPWSPTLIGGCRCWASAERAQS